MAITKTATRDLTTAIAGKIWEAIKDADDTRLENQSDPEVKAAKRDLDKEDIDATKVEDKPLRESLANMFGKIDVKLIQVKGEVETLSGKVSAVGGAIADTQKLIINQNQMIADKFDTLLETLGVNIDAEKKAREDLRYEQLGLNLGLGEDLSGSSGRLGGAGQRGGNILTTLLRRQIGRMFGRAGMRLFGRIMKSRLLRRPRVLAKLFKRQISRKLIRPTVSALSDNIVSKTSKRIGTKLLERALKSPVIRNALVKKLGKEGLEKLTLKLAGKAVPVAQTAYGAVEGLVRGAMGDWKGMMLSFGSAIPYAGYGFTAIDILRDIDIDAYTKHIEGKFPPSDQNIADFFQDALGISPSQYETGTRINPSKLGIGGIMSAITPIVSVSREFGAQAGHGMEVEAAINHAGLGGVPTERISHSFTVGGNISKSSIDPTTKVAKAPDIIPSISTETSTVEPESDVNKNIIDRAKERIRDITGGKVDDGVFSLPFGIEIPNWFNRKPKGTGEKVETDSVDPNTSMISTILPEGNPQYTSGFRTTNRPNHHGVDYGVDAGSPVMSALDGIVTHKGPKFGNHGGYVVVNDVDADGNKLSTANLYGHVKNVQVEIGDKVKQGDHLADIIYYPADPAYGKAGEDHSHLHFERFDGPGNNDQIDPIDFLKGTSNPQLQSKLAPLTSVPVASSLNSIESPTSNLVSEGSMNRQIAIKKNKKRSSIVVIANNVINSSTIHVPMGSRKGSDDPFAPINLARLG